MSIIKRIEALESASKHQGGSHGPDEIWLIGVSPGGAQCCGGGWVKENGKFRTAAAEESQRHNQHTAQVSDHG
ncbi:hypothetical protein Q2T70_06985 [Klebsiella oxytoca]|uniref:hypothetical protein n=1 Tax=Klebsiella oxytoca TaxID=571 RepID=UPI00265DE376|nr:hypothetical protein [Klebsiella oxytoca]WKM73464.1 hypothetical protein Q2T70_06985 [Klebsiella oxytoca]